MLYDATPAIWDMALSRNGLLRTSVACLGFKFSRLPGDFEPSLRKERQHFPLWVWIPSRVSTARVGMVRSGSCSGSSPCGWQMRGDRQRRQRPPSFRSGHAESSTGRVVRRKGGTQVSNGNSALAADEDCLVVKSTCRTSPSHRHLQGGQACPHIQSLLHFCKAPPSVSTSGCRSVSWRDAWLVVATFVQPPAQCGDPEGIMPPSTNSRMCSS